MKTKKFSFKKQVRNLQEAIFLKCLDCCCCQIKEVLFCNIVDCPLWELRPKKSRGLYTLVRKLKQKKYLNF